MVSSGTSSIPAGRGSGPQVHAALERAHGGTRVADEDHVESVQVEAARPNRECCGALCSWAFIKNAWEPDNERRSALDWIRRNSLSVGALADADVLRRVLDDLGRQLDGKVASAN